MPQMERVEFLASAIEADEHVDEGDFGAPRMRTLVRGEGADELVDALMDIRGIGSVPGSGRGADGDGGGGAGAKRGAVVKERAEAETKAGAKTGERGGGGATGMESNPGTCSQTSWAAS